MEDEKEQYYCTTKHTKYCCNGCCPCGCINRIICFLYSYEIANKPTSPDTIEVFRDVGIISGCDDVDIYAIAYYHFRFYAEDNQSSRLMIKAFFTFIVQFLLFYFILKEKHILDGQFQSSMPYGSTGLNIVRILCAYLLHQQVVQEVLEAKTMLSYAKKHAT